VVHEIQQDDCSGRAAQLAYYFLFAPFPFFLVLITLLGYLPIPNLMDRLMDMLAQMLPGDALHLVQDHVRELVNGERGGLLSFGLLAALWTSSSAMTAIMESLNRAYDVAEGCPFWKVRGLAILLTVPRKICDRTKRRRWPRTDPLSGRRLGFVRPREC
jgi:membrane protein